MEYAILPFFVVALLIAGALTMLALLLHLKYRQRFLLYVFLWALTSVVLAAAEIIVIYSSVTAAGFKGSARVAYYAIQYSASLPYMYVLPAASHVALARPMRSGVRIAHKTVLGLYGAVAGVLLIIHRSGIYTPLYEVMVAGAHLYGIVFLTSHYRDIEVAESRAVVRTILVFNMVFVPLILVNYILTSVGVIPAGIGRLPLARFVGLAALSLAGIYYAARYFFVSPERVERLLSVSNVRRFHLSEREREVLQLLLRGHGSRPISDRLFISQKTAKNHIYRIYQKTGVRSRIELFRKLGKTA
jgi:DNA-binding CsgD family transcriptional regulator